MNCKTAAPRRSQWHLRYRKSVTADFGGDEEDLVFSIANHSAAEIFSFGEGKDRSRNRRVKLDGHEIEYELRQKVNERPKDRKKPQFHVRNKNVVASPLFVRLRVWIMQYNILSIIFGYLFCFVIINVTFAILWYMPNDKCCGDPTMDFRDVLNFAIQTSTTLGYGDNEPVGLYSNILVTLNFFFSLSLHALFAGIIFLKFVTPSAKVEFSEIMTLSNVNGLQCLEMRVGNADGSNILLQDLTARLNFQYRIHYIDELGKPHDLRSFQDLKLLVSWRYELKEVWTVRHVIDEHSPLFGVFGVKGLQEEIDMFRLTISGMQDVTKMHIQASSTYAMEDVMIGYRFQDQLGWEAETETLICDYAKMNDVVPHPVWFPIEQPSLASTNEKEAFCTS